MIKTINRENAIVAYKAFNSDFKCNGFQYKVGKLYHINDKVKLCGKGFHACQDLIDTFYYYPIHNSRYAIVKLWGEVSFDTDKLCASDIEIIKELSLKDVVKHYVTSKTDFLEKVDYHHIMLKGQEKELLNNGDCNYINSSFDWKRIISSGTFNTITATGKCNTILDLGYNSIINCSGEHIRLVETGGEAKITLTDNPIVISYGNRNTITLLYNGGIAISNGNCCTINVISEHAYCTINGDYNKINVTGNNTIESNGVNNELILSSNYVTFKAKQGSAVTFLGKERKIVGESELMADTRYTYNFGIIERNNILDFKKNKF